MEFVIKQIGREKSFDAIGAVFKDTIGVRLFITLKRIVERESIAFKVAQD